MMDEDEFENIGPSWINNLVFDIRDNTAQPDDVELMMAYYCHLYQSSEGIPPKTLHQFLRLINQVFGEYLERKANNQFSGALEAAFGLTRKQGDRNLEKRNEDIATDVARYHIIRRDCSIHNATMKVVKDRDLKKSTIETAWKHHKVMAIIRVRLELKHQGKDFNPGQLKRAHKIIDPINRKVQQIIGVDPKK